MANRWGNRRSYFGVFRAPVLLLPGLILLFFNKMAFSNLILARGDAFLYFYPYWQAASEALRQGRIPLWNPHLFMGAPFLANSQVGFFYPLNWPLWLFFSVPVAVKVSILLHVLIAGVGAYLAGRRAWGLTGEAATVTAVLFALSGYLTAQVEHINQLQGLAWLPWYLVVLAALSANELQSWRRKGKGALAFSLLLALQLLAGHTQTVFISGVAVGIWLLASLPWRQAIRLLPPLLLGVGLAVLLTAVQLLPTLELTRYSSRQGGLAVNEVLSFSLHPLLLGQALLPRYGQSLFSEYAAFFPLTALLLAGLGAWRWRQKPGARAALLLVIVGLLLALGLFNPLNWLLARLPAFNLFRVPARWLVLYALGVALLAGYGWQQVRGGRETENRKRKTENGAQKAPGAARPLLVTLLLLIGLMGWAVLSQFLVPFLPVSPEAPFELPNRLTLLLWLAELALALFWFYSPRLAPGVWQRPGWQNLLYLGVGTAVLFFASRTHPYNNLTTPEAYFDLRPPIARLLAHGQEPMGDGPWPASSRFLSLSGIFFDPGDQGEIAAIYADQLDQAALYDYTVAIKQKEIIAPNLPLAYGLMAVDGFDGGILPLRSYSELVTLLLPPNTTTSDGRLRENITAVPDQRWLNLFNVRYLITDKTGDEWRDGVFFDRQHPLGLAVGETVGVGYVPPFAATALYLLADSAPEVTLTTAAQSWTPPAQFMAPGQPSLYRVGLTETAVLQQITLAAATAPVQIAGLALVNEEDGSFHPLVAGAYRLIHSGDVKIYENLDVLPRAFLVGQWQWQPDVPTSVAAMNEHGFMPGGTAVLLGSGLDGRSEGLVGVAEITQYAPERVVVRTQSTAGGLLLLSDANYPGWVATIDGQPADLHTANALFRAVFVPAGAHEVVFTFSPRSYALGRVLSLLGLALWGALAFFCTISAKP